MRDKLFYLHLKNSVGFMGQRFETSLAEGDINHRNYLRHLLQSGYFGCIGIEAPRGGDREYFAQCDYRYAREVKKHLRLKRDNDIMVSVKRFLRNRGKV